MLEIRQLHVAYGPIPALHGVSLRVGAGELVGVYLGGGIGRYKMPDPFFKGFHDGVTGDPNLATAEAGEKVYALVVDWICSVIRFDLKSNGGTWGKGI